MKDQSSTQIYVDGVFDLAHAGHFNAVRQAKALGHRVVVGVNSDEEVRAVKGTLPVYTEAERGEILRSCKWADSVVVGTTYTVTSQLLHDLNCTFCAHGDDFVGDANGADCYAEPRSQGRLKTFKRTEGISTTHLMRRLLDSSSPPLTPSRAPPHSDANCSLVASPSLSSRDVFPPRLSLPPSQQCITSTKRLTKFIGTERNPSPSDTIVYVDGSFDVFHVGHVRILNKAKTLGDYLIVGIHDDPTVQRMKGVGFPVVGMLERSLSVLAMRMVDEVIIGAPWVITEYLIKMFRINVVVRGTRIDSCCTVKEEDGTQQQNHSTEVEDPYEIPKKMGIYREVESSSTVTTREIIQRIRDNRHSVESRVDAKSVMEQSHWDSVTADSAPLLREL